MKIVNVLFSSKKGGMEQAFVDYTEALLMRKNKVVVIIKDDMLNIYVDKLSKLGAKIYKIKNKFGYLDYPLIFKIRRILKREKAETVIAHSGRAISISRRSCKGLCKIVGVNHSSNIKRSLKCDAIFVINTRAKKRVLNTDKSFKGRVFLMPNMIKIPEKIPVKKRENKTLVIGGIGRFVKAKGFEELIKAGKILNDKGFNFKIKIAGSGVEEDNLRNLVNELKLEKRVEFLGWINDITNEFFNKIDIFCLPSHFEPFGIVLLQAMLHKKTIISTNSEGPNDIFKNGKDAVIVSKDNLDNLPKNLAKALKKVLKDKNLRGKLAIAGYKNLLENYSMNSVSERMNEALKSL
jgi:glycosyltransferase involved in cell wall biosynthesis